MCIAKISPEANFMRTLILAMAALATMASTQRVEQPSKRTKGLYFRYEGAEYESALQPCSVKGIWHVAGEKPLTELISIPSRSMAFDWLTVSW